MVKQMRNYFMDMKLKTGEFVTVVYESTHRKNVWDHYFDLCCALDSSPLKDDIDWGYDYNKDTNTFAYILNDKNKDEQCFGHDRIVDIRGGRK